MFRKVTPNHFVACLCAQCGTVRDINTLNDEWVLVWHEAFMVDLMDNLLAEVPVLDAREITREEPKNPEYFVLKSQMCYGSLLLQFGDTTEEPTDEAIQRAQRCIDWERFVRRITPCYHGHGCDAVSNADTGYCPSHGPPPPL